MKSAKMKLRISFRMVTVYTGNCVWVAVLGYGIVSRTRAYPDMMLKPRKL